MNQKLILPVLELRPIVATLASQASCSEPACRPPSRIGMIDGACSCPETMMVYTHFIKVTVIGPLATMPADQLTLGPV